MMREGSEQARHVRRKHSFMTGWRGWTRSITVFYLHFAQICCKDVGADSKNPIRQPLVSTFDSTIFLYAKHLILFGPHRSLSL
jgi:hypothetical protein